MNWARWTSVSSHRWLPCPCCVRALSSKAAAEVRLAECGEEALMDAEWVPSVKTAARVLEEARAKGTDQPGDALREVAEAR